jgi:hypothetical protein
MGSRLCKRGLHPLADRFSRRYASISNGRWALDSGSVILAALTSGAARGVAESASDAIKDAYNRLKQLIAAQFANDETARVALAEHVEDPETWHAPLAKALNTSGASANPTIIDAAQQLMALLDGAGSRAGKYSVDIRGARGVQVGDRNQQVNLFGVPNDIAE